MQGVAEEELRGRQRFGGTEVAVKVLIESGVLSVEKQGRGGRRVGFLIGEEVEAALREHPNVGGVVRRSGTTKRNGQSQGMLHIGA
ncbi:hypothetical protein HOY80DRAFT_1033736 [Tuber brumale]|nr:hypothetical protein HOY80DRAFT_1033736 [Tuber brumale]